MNKNSTTIKQKFTILGILALTVVIVYILFFPKKELRMDDFSMEPELYQKDPLSVKPNYGKINRGNVITFEKSNDKGKKEIKTRRVIGLPNEEIRIKEGKVEVYKKNEREAVSLDESNYLSDDVKTYAGEAGDYVFETFDDEYFVLGDNRNVSQDSRHWGNIKKGEIFGRVRGTKDYNALAN